MKQKLGVSTRAVVQRINRKLAPDMEMLRKSRSVRSVLDVGEYYVINWRINGVMQKNVDVESLARELGVLKDWEKLAE